MPTCLNRTKSTTSKSLTTASSPIPNTAKQSLWAEYYLKAKLVEIVIAKKDTNKLEAARMWMLNFTEDEAKTENDTLTMTIDAPATMDMVVHLRKELAEDGLFKAAAKNPRTVLANLIKKDLQLAEHLHQEPFAIKTVSDYVKGEWQKDAGIQANIIVKVGAGSHFVKSQSGKYGIFNKAFGEEGDD